jgi:hypothetical protein
MGEEAAKASADRCRRYRRGTDYLMNMEEHSIRDLGCREILMMSAVLAGSGVVFSPKLTAAEATLQRTPDQILGPFYPLSELSRTSDLTRVPGRPERSGSRTAR